MKRQNVRVLLASERPDTRSLLRHIIETEDRAVIVAEAENGTRALSLARNLRPDIALIDSYLPALIGIDDVPLSRVGGLDVAQSISEEIPDMQVVLLNNPDDSVLSDRVWRPESNASLCRESKEACIPFTLGDLGDRLEATGNLIFANVLAVAPAAPVQKTQTSDRIILAGIIGVIAGWLMILTMFLATAGLYLVIAGALTSIIGVAGKHLLKMLK